MNCVILSESQIKIKNQARDVSFDVTRTDYILFESIIGQNDKLKDTLEPALERDDMVFRKR